MVSEKYLQNTPDQLRKGCGGLSPVPPSKGREIMAVLTETGRRPPTVQWATTSGYGAAGGNGQVMTSPGIGLASRSLAPLLIWGGISQRSKG